MFSLFFGRRFPLIGIAVGAVLIIAGLLVASTVLTARLEISGTVVLAVSGYRAWSAWRRHGASGFIRTRSVASPATRATTGVRP
jgi:hypothetical protein